MAELVLHWVLRISGSRAGTCTAPYPLHRVWGIRCLAELACPARSDLERMHIIWTFLKIHGERSVTVLVLNHALLT